MRVNGELKSKMKAGWAKLSGNSLTAITLILVGMLIIVSIGSEYFFTLFNLQSLVRDLAFIAMIAIGMSLLLLIGELDLSVGNIATLCGVMGGLMMVEGNVNPYLAFVLALLLGIGLGALNGLVISKLKLNAMVATIGMSGVYGGVVLAVTKGRAIPNIPEEIHFLGKGNIAYIPVPFIITLIILACALFFVKKTRTGRYVYAIGNSKETSALLGINIDRIRILLYSIVGFISAMAGMLYVARLGSAQSSIGGNWAMNAIASSVIGGVSLTGGIGSPLGALIGAAVICVIQNAIVLFGVNMYVQSAVSGVVTVLAISFSSISEMMKQRNERAAEFEKQKKMRNDKKEEEKEE